MIEYKEIYFNDYINLEDKSGYYCTIDEDSKAYRKNGVFHNEYDFAYIWVPIYQYWLNGVLYGQDTDYTTEEWIRFCKLKAFL